MKLLLRRLILLLIRLTGTLTAIGRSKKKHPISAEASRPLHILLIRPDHLGDLVMTTPVLQALKDQAPTARLTMMIGPWSSEVVARHPAIDRLIACPFPGFQRAPQSFLAPYRLLWTTAQQLRRQQYDLALNLRPDFWWGAALIYLAKIPQRIGYAIEPGRPFLTHALPFPATEHATVSNLRLVSTGLQALGLPTLEEPYTPQRYPLHFTPTAAEEAWASDQLSSSGIAEGAALVVIHAGTGGQVKLWRTEGWSHIANKLTTTTRPATIILTGSPKERPMLEAMAQGMTSAPLLLTNTTVGQLAALLGRAQLVLGVDNGPLHLAITRGTPTIRMYGPTDAHIFGPWGAAEHHIVLNATHKCPTCPAIPCGRLDFSADELAAHPCVRLIPEAEVEQAMQALLRNTYL